MRILTFVAILWAGALSAQSIEADPVKVYMVPEQMPRFPGCEEVDGSQNEKYSCAQKKLLAYIYGHVTYPDQARANRIEGTVIVRFHVQTDGRLSDIIVVKSLGNGCDEAGLVVVESMNHMDEKWIAGMQRGKPVVAQFNLPIRFEIQK